MPFRHLDNSARTPLVSQGREKKLHRQTVRFPEELHNELVRVSEMDKRTVSDWIVVTIDQAGRARSRLT